MHPHVMETHACTPIKMHAPTCPQVPTQTNFFCANMSKCVCVHMPVCDKQSKYVRNVIEGGKRQTFFVHHAS